jgi:hypothetical protein
MPIKRAVGAGAGAAPAHGRGAPLTVVARVRTIRLATEDSGFIVQCLNRIRRLGPGSFKNPHFFLRKRCAPRNKPVGRVEWRVMSRVMSRPWTRFRALSLSRRHPRLFPLFPPVFAFSHGRPYAPERRPPARPALPSAISFQTYPRRPPEPIPLPHARIIPSLALRLGTLPFTVYLSVATRAPTSPPSGVDHKQSHLTPEKSPRRSTSSHLPPFPADKSGG